MKGFSQIQKIGKALMTPIAILPAAGLFLAFGNKLGIPMMEQAGGVIFANLPLLFAIGSAIGLVGGDGVAALAAVVAILIMNITAGIVAGVTPELVASNSSRYAFVLGIPTLQTGVFGGLMAGIIAAICYNKYYKTELPAYLGFFAGKRLVPIVTAVAAFILGLVLPFIWEPVQSGLEALSNIANGGNTNISTFLFGVIERALIPFGLHHIFYAPFWFQFGEYTNSSGVLVQGDQAIWFAMLKDGIHSFSSNSYQGAGKFMTGKFPFMMFGLPAAALAMYHEAKSKNKKLVGGILFSAALTSFLTGITEPIEFSFLFLAPVLYGIHCIFAGLSFMLMNMLDVRIGMTFSGGIIDFTAFGIIPSMSGFETNWIYAVIVGIFFAIIYYFGFRFAIRKWNLMTPGREDDDTVDTIADSKDKISDNLELARLVLEALGGKNNLISVDACITRLRLEVVDSSLVNDSKLKNLGASGILKVGESGVQVIFGAKAQFIANDIKNF